MINFSHATKYTVNQKAIKRFTLCGIVYKTNREPLKLFPGEKMEQFA